MSKRFKMSIVIPLSISFGHQHEHSMIRCLALLEHDLVSLCQKSPACFLIKFPARYVSCACGPLHKQPQSPTLSPPLTHRSRLSAAALAEEETLIREPNPVSPLLVFVFPLRSSINQPRIPPIGGSL